MQINSISNNRNLNTFKAKGPKLNEEVLSNQYKILGSQLFNENPKKILIRKPQSEIEKKAVIEILKHRLYLNKFFRLHNEKVNLLANSKILFDMVENDPNNPEIETLRKELNKDGRYDVVLDRLNSAIEIEKKKHAASIDYFKNLRDLANEYEEKKLIKPNMENTYYESTVKYNINTSGDLREVLEILEGKKAALDEHVSEANPTETISKSEKIVPLKVGESGNGSLIVDAKKMFRNELNRNVAKIYADYFQNFEDRSDYIAKFERERSDAITNSRMRVMCSYDFICKNSKKFKNDIVWMIRDEIAEFDKDARLFYSIKGYPAGLILEDMKNEEKKIKELIQNLDKLNAQLRKSKKTKDAIKDYSAKLEVSKSEWLKGLHDVIEAEECNVARVATADYLNGFEKWYNTGCNARVFQNKENLSPLEEKLIQLMKGNSKTFSIKGLFKKNNETLLATKINDLLELYLPENSNKFKDTRARDEAVAGLDPRLLIDLKGIIKEFNIESNKTLQYIYDEFALPEKASVENLKKAQDVLNGLGSNEEIPATFWQDLIEGKVW